MWEMVQDRDHSKEVMYDCGIVVVVVEGKFVRHVFIQKYLRRASCSTCTQTASSLGYV